MIHIIYFANIFGFQGACFNIVRFLGCTGFYRKIDEHAICYCRENPYYWQYALPCAACSHY
jgi:hypothetical protein